MNKDRPALVILSPGFPASEADTTCLPAQQDLVRLLHEARPALEIIIIAFQYPYTNERYEWNGVPVIPLNGQNRKKFHRIRTWLKAWRALKKLKRRFHLIGFFSFWLTETALIGKWFGRRHGIRHYCWMLGQDARPGNNLVPLIRPGPNELVALSDFLADEFYRNYAIRPAHVIPSGIDPTRFVPTPGVQSDRANSDRVGESAARESEQTARTVDLLAVGSLIPLKQHVVFLQVIQALKTRLPGLLALICGKGPEEENLRGLIHEYGLEENVRLVGELPHPEILRLMQRTRILLHPSSYEGFGTVCLEALYAGAHVISFCRPMKATISHWHIVADREEMIAKTWELLTEKSDNARVMAYSMQDNARAVLRLFPYIEVTI